MKKQKIRKNQPRHCSAGCFGNRRIRSLETRFTRTDGRAFEKIHRKHDKIMQYPRNAGTECVTRIRFAKTNNAFRKNE